MSRNCTEGDMGRSLSIEKACQDYSESVKLSLEHINEQLDDVLTKNTIGLDELAVKIAARTKFLEKNPSFLSCLVYNKANIQRESLLVFDDIRITLKEHSHRIQEKLKEIEAYHKKLLQLVAEQGVPSPEVEESFHDCASERELKVTLPAKTNFKVIITKQAFSERDFTKDTPLNLLVFNDVVPEVERGRPLEDLHQKLVKQVEASDSLEGFLKLMDRKPADFRRKYAGSLWFFSENMKERSVTPRQSSNLLCCSSQTTPTTRSTNSGVGKKKLGYFDLLDDIDYKDLKPIRSEYPRRDNVHLGLQDAKTYLHRMMKQNERVWKKLLETPEKRRVKKKPRTMSKEVRNLMTYLTSPGQRGPSSITVMPVQVTYHNFPKIQKRQEMLDRLKELEQKNHNVQRNIEKSIHDLETNKVKELMEFLTAPGRKFLPQTPQNLIVMPVKVLYDNFPTKDKESPRDLGVFPLQRKKEMLEQLKGLKMRNDNIQKNIQKAIDVIETKMIDLLSSPNDASSNAAFTAMEKEITHVLKMMHEEKVEPEKDDTPKVGSPKLRRGLTIVRKSPRVDGEKKRDLSVESRKGDGSGEKKKKRDKSCETKKTANMEEGERLLGKVDTVIKKIDSIYNRFYEEKPKKNVAETEVVQVEDYKYYEDTPVMTNEAVTFHQTRLYHIPIHQFVEKVKPHFVSVIQPDLFSAIQPHPVVKTEVEESHAHALEESHAHTLKLFYILFFSGVFVALNFDYAA